MHTRENSLPGHPRAPLDVVDCGIALEINSEDRSKVEVILAENAIYGEFRSPLNP